MKELATPHWLLGTPLTLGGGLAFRFGRVLFSGRVLVACQLVGLLAVALGLFVVARGVSQLASRRDSE
jgi:hypothetical protein